MEWDKKVSSMQAIVLFYNKFLIPIFKIKQKVASAIALRFGYDKPFFFGFLDCVNVFGSVPECIVPAQSHTCENNIIIACCLNTPLILTSHHNFYLKIPNVFKCNYAVVYKECLMEFCFGYYSI